MKYQFKNIYIYEEEMLITNNWQLFQLIKNVKVILKSITYMYKPRQYLSRGSLGMKGLISVLYVIHNA